jgi:hypothetical protein
MNGGRLHALIVGRHGRTETAARQSAMFIRSSRGEGYVRSVRGRGQHLRQQRIRVQRNRLQQPIEFRRRVRRGRRDAGHQRKRGHGRRYRPWPLLRVSLSRQQQRAAATAIVGKESRFIRDHLHTSLKRLGLITL